MERKNKISETRLKEVVKSVVSEISINKKKELTKNAFNAVKGVQDNIKTFCIVTGENPMGEPGSNKLNRTNKKSLTDYLRFGNFAWTTVRGKYGNSENPKIIFNVTLSDAKIIAIKFMQESFIFGRKMDDKVYFSKKDWVLKDEYLEETKRRQQKAAIRTLELRDKKKNKQQLLVAKEMYMRKLQEEKII